MTQQINVQGTEISIISSNAADYISPTDMLKAKDGEFFIADWLRNRNTLEFLGIWERINNPKFNYGEFAIIRNQAGLNSYTVSVKEWVQKTGAIGLKATTGRYGGTYAHADIASNSGCGSAPKIVSLYKERKVPPLLSLSAGAGYCPRTIVLTLMRALYLGS
jgi:KilA-N domain